MTVRCRDVLAENRSRWARASVRGVLRRGGFFDDPPDALGRKPELHSPHFSQGVGASGPWN